ncbi:hypothetical protein H6G54_24820 [Anabaena cylindrica FACHB-243]|uniref:Uncharacterized protein n=1 Tax=Anabaena cylindrica (strain ATCC 27899 / PCC 7122) TaxID=272123 RepID=K9ZDF9_ANACC|nr:MULTISPECIES: hypothetical protein [Anabaena]AFZ57196.1 hypothetical protein Anacy_1697 [Anabaena cylindrica PCC 7122]MBD2420867.1 hypothetical protein [Anabaena cylindrica FACHB-243]MBY5285398.1 hypothetical protein [Anabaena sp. CCAP 1446/1C]MBY5311388.1 hypothetical protein [Anabaena sp. CCAP 1446/1C]MCM2405615.1 hypothetical protein [Anabaena sp. CCAP 1446/1C]
MKKIVIADLKSNNAASIFRDLSVVETETVSGGSGGSVNNYFISGNTGNVETTGTGDVKGVDSGPRDNKIATIDNSRSIYVVINSW